MTKSDFVGLAQESVTAVRRMRRLVVAAPPPPIDPWTGLDVPVALVSAEQLDCVERIFVGLAEWGSTSREGAPLFHGRVARHLEGLALCLRRSLAVHEQQSGPRVARC